MLQLSDSMKNCRPPDNADREPTTKIAPAIPTGIPAFLTATQICDGIHHRYDRIHALEIEYDYTSRTFVEDERHVPFAEYHFAFSGPNRFKAQSIVTTDGRYVYPHHFWAWDAQLQQNFNVDSKDAYIKTEKDEWVEHDIYLSTAGVPIESFEQEWAHVKGTCIRPWLYQFVDRRWHGKCFRASKWSTVRMCHVLQSKFKDKVWIDPEIGFGVRFSKTTVE